MTTYAHNVKTIYSDTHPNSPNFKIHYVDDVVVVGIEIPNKFAKYIPEIQKVAPDFHFKLEGNVPEHEGLTTDRMYPDETRPREGYTVIDAIPCNEWGHPYKYDNLDTAKSIIQPTIIHHKDGSVEVRDSEFMTDLSKFMEVINDLYHYFVMYPEYVKEEEAELEAEEEYRSNYEW